MSVSEYIASAISEFLLSSIEVVGAWLAGVVSGPPGAGTGSVPGAGVGDGMLGNSVELFPPVGPCVGFSAGRSGPPQATPRATSAPTSGARRNRDVIDYFPREYGRTGSGSATL